MHVSWIHLSGREAALVRAGPSTTSVPRPAVDRTLVGRLDGVPAQETLASTSAAKWVTSASLITTPRTRSLATSTDPHVLLETVATRAHQSAAPARVEDAPTPGDPDGAQQQELLAPGKDSGNAIGDDERVAQEVGDDGNPILFG